jgi:hypothetical protein
MFVPEEEQHRWVQGSEIEPWPPDGLGESGFLTWRAYD